MGQVLYRKYRSKSFDDVVGQDHIVKTLKNALAEGRVGHAYLFTGPRGVGKTSVARILAHEVNQLEYKPDSVHLDIIEIDAASNRRIDEIRNLRDKVHIAPTSAQYKVYIIDEVHMLTKEAFNALLKTLEEPPEHCIFILATTEAHKLPETIISRTQRYSFRPITEKDAEKHLANLAKQEDLDITPEALELLALHGRGSFRDSINLLDQLSGSKDKIDGRQVGALLGIPERSLVIQILHTIGTKQPKKLLKILEELWSQGADPSITAKYLASAIRKKEGTANFESYEIALLKQLIDVPASSDPRDYLEISLLEAASTETLGDTPEVTVTTPEAPSPSTASTEIPNPTNPPDTVTKSIDSKLDFDISDWPTVVDSFKDEAPSLHTALRLTEAEVNGSELCLYFEFPLHQKKVNKPEAKLQIEGRVAELFGVKIKIRCDVDKLKFSVKPKLTKQIETPQLIGNIDSISNIFGPAEVLES